MAWLGKGEEMLQVTSVGYTEHLAAHFSVGSCWGSAAQAPRDLAGSSAADTRESLHQEHSTKRTSGPAFGPLI